MNHDGSLLGRIAAAVRRDARFEGDGRARTARAFYLGGTHARPFWFCPTPSAAMDSAACGALDRNRCPRRRGRAVVHLTRASKGTGGRVQRALSILAGRAHVRFGFAPAAYCTQTNVHCRLPYVQAIVSSPSGGGIFWFLKNHLRGYVQ